MKLQSNLFPGSRIRIPPQREIAPAGRLLSTQGKGSARPTDESDLSQSASIDLHRAPFHLAGVALSSAHCCNSRRRSRHIVHE